MLNNISTIYEYRDYGSIYIGISLPVQTFVSMTDSQSKYFSSKGSDMLLFRLISINNIYKNIFNLILVRENKPELPDEEKSYTKYSPS
jgi:hypothetical protein